MKIYINSFHPLLNEWVNNSSVPPLLHPEEVLHRGEALLDAASRQELLHCHGVPQEDCDDLEDKLFWLSDSGETRGCNIDTWWSGKVTWTCLSDSIFIPEPCRDLRPTKYPVRSENTSSSQLLSHAHTWAGIASGQHWSSALSGSSPRQEVVKEAGAASTDVGMETGHSEHPEPVESPLGRPRHLGEHPLQQEAQ